MKYLTNREEEIMEIFWKNSSMFVREVIKQLHEPTTHYNTISTIVRGLEDKGFLDHEQYGNTYRYFPIISRKEFGKTSIKQLVSKYFDKSYASVVSMGVEEKEISIEEIQKLIEQFKSTKKDQK